MRVWPAHILAPLLLLLILTGGTKLHTQPLPPARTVWLTTQGDTVVVSRTDIVSFDTASRTLRVSDTILQRLSALN